MCSRRQLPLLLLLPCLSDLCLTFSATALDTLSVVESLTGSRSLVSDGGNFELGFFSPAGNASYYVGIWYKQIPERTVIWVMNRDSPVSDPSTAELKIAPDGSNLVLLQANGSEPKNTVWSSNSTRSCNEPAEAVLLNAGNLVLRCRYSSAIVWQSFDHPTDTLVPGAWFRQNKSSGAYQAEALRSWRSAVDPSTGLYMDRLDPHGSGQYTFLWNGTTIYHYVGAWTDNYFASIPEMGIPTDKYEYFFVNNDEEASYSFQVKDPSTMSRLVMTPQGQLTMFDWNNKSGPAGRWVLHWATPTSRCDVYSVCGPFGVCDLASSQYCRCLPGFAPAGDSWNGGCARKTRLNCSHDGPSTSTDGFLPVQNVMLPSTSSSMAGAGSAGDCASACLSSCSCTAYAYKDGCLVWGGDLRNVQQLADGGAGASTLFLRVAAAELADGYHGTSTGHRNAVVAVSAAAIFVVLCFLLFVPIWIWRRSRTVRHDGSLLVFSHGYLAQCTKNYSQKLGMGSFGSVYKGTLRDHTAVAVKRLEGSAQGEKQFRAEVRTLGTIHHVNLVRLHGFCASNQDRLLVYEYLPNGSLASAMSGQSFRLLDWGTRFRIMAGVARGLAYLHEECHERIVHCDVKPENILLGADFCPKVADLGMAKLIGRDLSRVLTTARGTVGYLAPEWIMGAPITAKADVYSYGMTLLELIAGRRNQDADGRGMGYFPLWAATKAGEGRFAAILDERLAGNADMEELSRACNVACWCIQQKEAMRPTMGQVVQVLEGSLRVGAAPMPRYLEMFCADGSLTF